MARLDDGTPVMIPHGGEAPENEDRIAELLRFADREPVGSCSVCGADIYSEDALRDRDGMCASCYINAIEPDPDEPEDGKCCGNCVRHAYCMTEPDDYCRYWEEQT